MTWAELISVFRITGGGQLEYNNHVFNETFSKV